MRQQKMMCYNPRFSPTIPLRTSRAIRSPPWGKNTHTITVTTNYVWLIECDPVFYAVTEKGEACSGVGGVVGDYGAGEEASVAVLEGLREVPVI